MREIFIAAPLSDKYFVWPFTKEQPHLEYSMSSRAKRMAWWSTAFYCLIISTSSVTFTSSPSMPLPALIPKSARWMLVVADMPR
jgi:hypothetical protein